MWDDMKDCEICKLPIMDKRNSIKLGLFGHQGRAHLMCESNPQRLADGNFKDWVILCMRKQQCEIDHLRRIVDQMKSDHQ